MAFLPSNSTRWVMALVDDVQVLARAGRVEEGAGKAVAFAVFLGNLVVAEAFLIAVVVVFVNWEAFSLGSLNPGVANLVMLAHVGDVQRAAFAAGVIVIAFEML